MSIFLWILAAIGIIILAIISILLILLSLNVHIIIEYNQLFSFKIKIAFIDLTKLFTKDDKKESKDNNKASKLKKRKNEIKQTVSEQNKKKTDIKSALNIITRILNEIKEGFFRKIVVKNARIHIICAGDDAAQTAINYGIICAAVYPVTGFIDSECRVKKKDINVSADFTKQKSEADIYLHLKLRILHIAVLLMKTLLGGEK